MTKQKNPVEMPKPPDFLSGKALEIWNEHASRLYAFGLLDEHNYALFGFFCKSYATYKRFKKDCEQIRRNSQNISDEDKEKMSSVQQILWEHIPEMGKEFCINPKK